jgi:ATP-dependent protease ClpP protease subunit
MAITKAQYRAQKKYDAAHTKQFQMKLHIENDADILTWLDAQDSKQGAIKELIRRDIQMSKKGKK